MGCPLLPHLIASQTGTRVVTWWVFQSQWALWRFLIVETQVLSHFLLSQDENSQCSIALKIFHLFPGVRHFGLAATHGEGIAFKSFKVWSSISPKSSLFGISHQAHLDFSPSFKARAILLREAVFGNALTLYMRRCTWWHLLLASSQVANHSLAVALLSH